MTTRSTSTIPRAIACSSSARWTRSAGTARAGPRSSGNALPSKTERFAEEALEFAHHLQVLEQRSAALADRGAERLPPVPFPAERHGDAHVVLGIARHGFVDLQAPVHARRVAPALEFGRQRD